MPTKQTQLDFAIRKSNRLRSKETKGADITSETKNKERLKEEATPKAPHKSEPLTPSKRRENAPQTECSPPKRLPFSPRKRVDTEALIQDKPVRRKLIGTENEENIPPKSPNKPAAIPKPRSSSELISQGAPRFLSPVRGSPRKVLDSPNEIAEKIATGKRLILSPRKQLQFSPRKVDKPPSASKADGVFLWAHREQHCFVDFESAKRALNTQQPTNIVCREREIGHIFGFLTSHMQDHKPGSMYISGAPGTGKTVVIKHLLSSCCQNCEKKVFINSMTIKSPYLMYKSIAQELLGDRAAKLKNARSACSAVEKYLSSKGEMVLLVLDEIDQLDTKNQEVLYTIFEWPSLVNSRLILIGIANALDLTDRILPRLNVRAECKPELFHFTPYSKEQIVNVLESRLQHVGDSIQGTLDKAAVAFCARKVSAVSGDMRKALDICRRSIEVTQMAQQKDHILRKGSPLVTGRASVGIQQIAKVVDEVYGSTNSAATPSTFPLQQKLFVCALLLILKSSKLKEITLGKAHDVYCRVCRKRDVTAMDQSEFIGMSDLLEARGLISIKKSKEIRQKKITLKLDAKELEFALQDKTLITAVLESGL